MIFLSIAIFIIGVLDDRDPVEMIEEARKGLEIAGEEFERGNFFLMELIRAAQIFKVAAALLDPVIKECHGDIQVKGTILIGTVAGDVHDLGKGIVATLLQCAGFDVIDLGVDVSEAEFVEKIRENSPQVVAALLPVVIKAKSQAKKRRKLHAQLRQAGHHHGHSDHHQG